MSPGWKALARGIPGRRFASAYEERQRRRESGARRATVMAAGVALLLLGMLLIVTPGPGLLVILVGAWLVASESRAIAHALDWCELKARALLRTVNRRGRPPASPRSGSR
jgi:hypothetical protein